MYVLVSDADPRGNYTYYYCPQEREIQITKNKNLK